MHHLRSANLTFIFILIPKNPHVFFSFFHICHLKSLYLTSPICLLHIICTSKFSHWKIFHSSSQKHLSIFLCPPHRVKIRFFFLKLNPCFSFCCIGLLSGKRELGERKKNGQGNEVCSNMGRGSTKANCISPETTTAILKLAKAWDDFWRRMLRR